MCRATYNKIRTNSFNQDTSLSGIGESGHHIIQDRTVRTPQCPGQKSQDTSLFRKGQSGHLIQDRTVRTPHCLGQNSQDTSLFGTEESGHLIQDRTVRTPHLGQDSQDTSIHYLLS